MRTTYKKVMLAVFAGMLSGCGGGGSPGGDGAAGPPGVSHQVGGSVTGVLGPGLILKLNGQSDLSVATDRGFKFPDALPAGSAYAVTVHNHPAGQRCQIDAGAAGAVSATSESGVTVSCAALPGAQAPTGISGTIEGLVGSGLTLRSTGGTLSIPPGATEFTFPPPAGLGPLVEVLQQPTRPTQACTPIAGSDSIINQDPNHPLVRLRCTTIQLPAAGRGLALNTVSLVFAGEQGDSVAPQSVVGLWAESDPVAFVQVVSSDPALFSAEEFRLSPTSTHVRVRPAPAAALPPGTHTGTVTVAACISQDCTQVAGAPLVVNVSYEVKPNRPVPALTASTRGIAFTEVPGASRLGRILTVSDSAAAPVAWRASADAPWITVTASGSRGSELAVTADPTQLAEGFHQATITVRSDDPAITRPEKVRVGLYKSTAPRAVRVADPGVAPGRVVTVADPIRPLFYRHSGNTLVAHHAYTGRSTGTLQLTGAAIESLAVSDDGAWLYMLDNPAPTSGRPRRMVVVNLDTLSVQQTYSLPQLRDAHSSAPTLMHAVVNGRGVLLLNSAVLIGRAADDIPPAPVPVIDAATGAAIGSLHGIIAARVIAGNGGPVVYAYGPVDDFDNSDGRPDKFARMELRSNAVGNVYGVPVGAVPGGHVVSQLGSGRTLAVSADSNRVAFAAEFSPSFQVMTWNGASHEVQAGFQADNIVQGNLFFDADGRLLRVSVLDLPFFMANLHSAGGTLLRSFNWNVGSGPILEPTLSSDGFTLLTSAELIELPP
jgi:hypothetical protein